MWGGMPLRVFNQFVEEKDLVTQTIPAAVRFVAVAVRRLVRPSGPAGRNARVADTYNKAPFSYREELDREFDSFRIYRLTYPSPVSTSLKQNNTITAEFYLPRGMNKESKPRPAVICLHILGGG